MPRENRVFPEETAMHIICRGNNKLPILADSSDKEQCYCQLLRFKSNNQVDIFHYCIMDSHLHLIVWLKHNNNLPRFIKQMSLAYYYYYKRKYGYCGHLWQGKYRSIIIKSDAQALQCGKYIELNPVKAKIVAEPGQYQFSSYGYYALGKQDRLVTPNPAYEYLGANPLAKRQAYANFIISKEISSLVSPKNNKI